MTTRRFGPSLLLLVLAAASVVATQPVAAQVLRIDDIDASRFVDKNEIRFYVDLLDRDGTVVGDLKPEDVKILIDDKEIPGRKVVEEFHQTPDAVAVAIIVGAHPDYMTEYGEATPFEMAMSGVEQFVRTMRQVDKVSLWFYDEKGIQRVNSFQEGGEKTASAITRQARTMVTDDSRSAPGAPKLYRDLLTTLRKDLRDEFETIPTIKRKVIVIMSDGLDEVAKNDPQKIQSLIDEIADEAWNKGHIKIYTIGFSTISGGGGYPYLSQMSTKTNGASKALGEGAGGTDIDRAWADLADQIKRQYVISFYPEDLDGGQAVKFQIQAEVKGGKVSTVADFNTPLGEKPFNWKGLLMWVGIGLGGLLVLFLIYKLIRAWLDARANAPPPPEVVVVESGPVGASKGKLAMTKGPMAGNIFYLTDDVTTIGSIDGNSIIIEDGSVSKRHAGIKIDDLRYELADFGSTNGVFVNGRKVSKQFLKDGDEIRIGNSEMVFSLK